MIQGRTFAGNLRYRINIMELIDSLNEYGEIEKTMSLYRSVRSDRKYVSGAVYEIADQMKEQVTIEFTIRFDENVTTKMLVEYKSQLYKIVYVQHIHEEVTLIKCKLSKDNVL